MALFNRAKGLVSRGLEAAGGLVSQGVEELKQATPESMAAATPYGQALNLVRPGTTDQIVGAGRNMVERGMTQANDSMDMAKNAGQAMQNAAQYTPGGMMADMVMGNPNPATQALKDQMSNLMQLSGRASSKIAMKSAKMFGTNEYRNQK